MTKTHCLFIARVLTCVLLVPVVIAADRKLEPDRHPISTSSPTAPVPHARTEGCQIQPPAVPPVTIEPTATPVSNPVITQPTAPLSGEQIKWQVISGGGGSGSSTNFKLSATAGQTATGVGSSTSYKVNQGFWQNFVTSCCVGVTGNVNAAGIVDLADLSALVSYLTGGGYVLPCVPEANVNNSGIVDLADLSALVSYLTGGGYVLPNCL
jgi:hypothetical protein